MQPQRATQTRVVQNQHELTLMEIRLEAKGVVSLAFRHPEGSRLPEWQPGAHLEVVLPSGRVRHYSLCGDPSDRHVYRVAVLRVDGGRGGSAEVHDDLKVGRIYTLRGPRNHFALMPAAAYLFIAGGIGITPILPMIEAMRGAENWRALYCGRSRSGMAFLDRLARRPEVTVLSDDSDGRPDFAAEISNAPRGTAVYCCGPEGMLDLVSEACSARPDITLCTERFAASTTPSSAGAPNAAGTEVHLARSGITVTVGAGESVLQAIRRAKPDVAWSCEAGFCGTCETAIIEGDVEHLDQLHSEAERVANRTMMICVSRPLSSRLVLDL
ncbi:PDR/VanB family oxidoreductase [Aquibium sp. A9E412]|uniref:PDR/VanB family oxidoreductase n=1 Tax=Aquibium sp. A9E412 TaxID=2976767 RepID=UPI0025B1919E|nr:PDR/VanB family oxidoreductase [Aquibium sp. A9E412]MDN2565752.1 PDR/VanB family oxidoreductase [Aquibium sp. A9E412]